MDTRHPHLRASECLDLVAHVSHVDVGECIVFCGVFFVCEDEVL